MFLDPLWCNSK